MSFPDYLLLAVVLLIGVFASPRNMTAAALTASYFAVQGVWLATGAVFDTRITLLIDLTVIAAIYCKLPAHECWPYRDRQHQFCSLWLERSIWDRVVLSIFPVAWAVYFLPLATSTAFWYLYWLAIAQFVAAGGEALQSYLSARTANAGKAAPDSSAGSPFNANWREWGYG